MDASLPQYGASGNPERPETLLTPFRQSPLKSRRTTELTYRLPLAAGLIVAILQVCRKFPHVDHATVGLLMIAAIVGLATVWGRAESLTSAVIGGLGYDYYFLPPQGFGIEQPEHLLAMGTFLFAAAAAGHLAARSKQLLEQRNSLLNLSLDPLCIGDMQGNFRSVNQAMVKVLGWPESELVSKPWLELVHPDDHGRTKDAVQSASAGGTVEFENRYRAKDGTWRWLHWKIAAPALGASWLSEAAHDVTEEKSIEEKLRNLADRVMTAQEEERRRVAGELHDDVTQRLATIGIELGLLKRGGPRAEAPPVTEELSRLQSQVIQLSEDIRGLSHSLHPSILEHSDLTASLEMHCREFSSQHGIETSFSARGVPPDIPHPVAIALYRIAQESLRNIAQHSGARTASVVLAGEAGQRLSLFVIDDGKGFDVGKAKVAPGLGLISMEERARQIGATMSVESLPDAGTRLAVHVPLGQRVMDK